MPIINNKMYTKEEILKKCGNMNQIAGYKRYVFNEGRAKGLEAIDVDNGNGLNFTILLDRCLDIANCSYRGVNFSYITNNGLVAPKYYDSSGSEWLRSFSGGLLSTCGIRQAGADCEDAGEKLGVHGRIGNSPGDNICCRAYWKNDDYIINISGQAYETKLHGENIVLRREIEVITGENKIYLHDEIENLGYKKEPIMMIYHINFGFPLYDEACEIKVDSNECIPNNEDAKKEFENRFIVTEPVHLKPENVYFHKMNNRDRRAEASIYNRNLLEKGAGMEIKFDVKELPYLNQWKMIAEKHYVLGLEPSNCRTFGRFEEREKGTLRYIEPGEIKHFNIEFNII